jgi:hypothetical protein
MLLGIKQVCFCFRLLDFHHLWCRIQLLRLESFRPKDRMFSIGSSPLFSRDPHPEDGFRLFPFRSPLLWESLLLSFPSATKMFQFTELPLTHL